MCVSNSARILSFPELQVTNIMVKDQLSTHNGETPSRSGSSTIWRVMVSINTETRLSSNHTKAYTSKGTSIHWHGFRQVGTNVSVPSHQFITPSTLKRRQRELLKHYTTVRLVSDFGKYSFRMASTAVSCLIGNLKSRWTLLRLGIVRSVRIPGLLQKPSTLLV